MNDMLVPAYMVTLVGEVDASALDRLRNQAKSQDQSASYTAIIMKITGLLMKQNPTANRAVLGWPFFKQLFQFKTTDISVAVEKSLPFLPGLAFAPTVKNAESKKISEIAAELQQLAKCDESNNATFATYMKILKRIPRPFAVWIINLPYLFPSLWPRYRGCAAWVNAPSKAGADLVMTTWPWPLTFSFGIVKQRPFIIHNQVQPCLTIPVVMVFDRRVMGGGPAGRLFSEFQKMIETADTLLAKEI